MEETPRAGQSSRKIDADSGVAAGEHGSSVQG